MIVGLLQSLSFFALSSAKPGQFCLVFIVQGVLAGTGMGLTYAPSIAVISHHFAKRRTLMVSLVTSGTPLGSTIHPTMLNRLLNDTVGCTRGVRASAGFVSALLLISCLSMRTRERLAPAASYSAVARKCPRKLLSSSCPLGQRHFRSGFSSLYFIYNWTPSSMGLTSISRSTSASA
ncbi:hypothetical protein DFH29DRAFT_393802, partial [Suillus ampliporus]